MPRPAPTASTRKVTERLLKLRAANVRQPMSQIAEAAKGMSTSADRAMPLTVPRHKPAICHETWIFLATLVLPNAFHSRQYAQAINILQQFYEKCKPLLLFGGSVDMRYDLLRTGGQNAAHGIAFGGCNPEVIFLFDGDLAGDVAAAVVFVGR